MRHVDESRSNFCCRSTVLLETTTMEPQVNVHVQTHMCLTGSKSFASCGTGSLMNLMPLPETELPAQTQKWLSSNFFD